MLSNTIIQVFTYLFLVYDLDRLEFRYVMLSVSNRKTLDFNLFACNIC
jgi:hypothetical protein